MANLDPQIKTGLLAIADAIGIRSGLDTTDKTTIVNAINETLLMAKQIVIPIGGQYTLTANRINIIGQIGPFDDSNSLNGGDTTVTNLNRNAGGYSFPFDVVVKRFRAEHKNSNTTAEAWGWVVARQLKTPASNIVSTNFILNETADNANVGPRDYGNTQNQVTDVDLSAAANNIVPAGEVITIGVSAPTADATARYVQVMDGYLYVERV